MSVITAMLLLPGDIRGSPAPANTVRKCLYKYTVSGAQRLSSFCSVFHTLADFPRILVHQRWHLRMPIRLIHLPRARREAVLPIST